MASPFLLQNTFLSKFGFSFSASMSLGLTKLASMRPDAGQFLLPDLFESFWFCQPFFPCAFKIRDCCSLQEMFFGCDCSFNETKLTSQTCFTYKPQLCLSQLPSKDLICLLLCILSSSRRQH